MLYYVMRPSSMEEQFPTFTRFGGLSKSLAGCRHKALACGGRVYSTDGGAVRLEADFYVEPVPEPTVKFTEYRARRNQAALFA